MDVDQGPGLTPKLVYMWAVVTEDGNSAYPQYNLDTGEETSWAKVAGLKPDYLMWTPIPREISHKVAGTATLPVPSVILELNPDDIPVWTRRGVYTRTTSYVCQDCGAVFVWDGNCDLECGHCGHEFHWSPDMELICPECKNPVKIVYRAAVCPKCGAKDLWYCDVCKEFKATQLHLANNECRCPDCEPIDKHGLIRHKKVKPQNMDLLETHYVLGVRGQFEIEMVPFDKSLVDDISWKLVFMGRPHLVIEYDDTYIEINGKPLTLAKGDIVTLGPEIRAPNEFVIKVQDGNIRVKGDDDGTD